ncbi:hypothetical protein V1502_03275 [Bacillus sp. SCS-153A]|uniref:hypothetical protein n=1 Tax=Rossellomorea sedimentorum TaxID=3115294 RepID=UPI003905A417
MINLFFLLIFGLGIYHLLRYRLNLKKAAETSKEALFPTSKKELSSILLPGEWLEMEPLTKDSTSYRVVKWGTLAALVLLTLLLWVILFTNWVDTMFFSISYLFFLIISAVRHRGNFFVLPGGIILNARYYHFSEIKIYEAEKIIKWHELYGLDPRANNGYKLSFKIKNKLFQPNFLVIQHQEQMEKIWGLLEENGVSGVKKEAS